MRRFEIYILAFIMFAFGLAVGLKLPSTTVTVEVSDKQLKEQVNKRITKAEVRITDNEFRINRNEQK